MGCSDSRPINSRVRTLGTRNFAVHARRRDHFANRRRAADVDGDGDGATGVARGCHASCV